MQSDTPLKSFSNWVLAARLKTLTAAIIPIMAATALAKMQGFVVEWWVTAQCLFSATCIQIATNFINDSIDFKKGADTVERIGPKRVTQAGLINQKTVLKIAYVILLLSMIAGIPLVIRGGWVICAVGLTSMFFAYAYTGGPFPLAYEGLGDIFVLLFFGIIAVGGVYYLQAKTYSIEALVLGIQMGLLSTVLIAINNLRDVFQDAKVGKKTLAVRFGIAFVRAEIVILIGVAFLLQFYWLYFGQVKVFLLPLIFLPLGFIIIRNILKTTPSSIYNQYLAFSALLHAGFGLIIAIGFYWA